MTYLQQNVFPKGCSNNLQGEEIENNLNYTKSKGNMFYDHDEIYFAIYGHDIQSVK